MAKCAGKSGTDLSPIFVSLAITYFDLKCPQDAIDCYMKELETFSLEEGDAKKVNWRVRVEYLKFLFHIYVLLTIDSYLY